MSLISSIAPPPPVHNSIGGGAMQPERPRRRRKPTPGQGSPASPLGQGSPGEPPRDYRLHRSRGRGCHWGGGPIPKPEIMYVLGPRAPLPGRVFLSLPASPAPLWLWGWVGSWGCKLSEALSSSPPAPHVVVGLGGALGLQIVGSIVLECITSILHNTQYIYRYCSIYQYYNIDI